MISLLVYFANIKSTFEQLGGRCEISLVKGLFTFDAAASMHFSERFSGIGHQYNYTFDDDILNDLDNTDIQSMYYVMPLDKRRGITPSAPCGRETALRNRPVSGDISARPYCTGFVIRLQALLGQITPVRITPPQKDSGRGK